MRVRLRKERRRLHELNVKKEKDTANGRKTIGRLEPPESCSCSSRLVVLPGPLACDNKFGTSEDAASNYWRRK